MSCKFNAERCSVSIHFVWLGHQDGLAAWSHDGK